MTSGFRSGIYVCKDAEILDFAAPHGVFAVARRFDPELEAFLVADALRPVQTGRMVTAGGITSGMEMGFHLLRRAGYTEKFIEEVARAMEYSQAYQLYRDDVEVLQPAVTG